MLGWLQSRHRLVTRWKISNQNLDATQFREEASCVVAHSCGVQCLRPPRRASRYIPEEVTSTHQVSPRLTNDRHCAVFVDVTDHWPILHLVCWHVQRS